MSPNVHKILPPGLVVVATLYFGWPPSGPLVHSDNSPRLTSVRWKLDDLKAPERNRDRQRSLCVGACRFGNS